MRELLVEVHHRAWLATALAAVLAAACALLGFASPAALAAMAAGALLMWVSEEERRLLAAMAPGDDPIPAPVLAAVPVRGSAIRVREWASPFPAGRPAPRQRPQERRAGRRRA
jgi:hypothetical protein